MTSDIMIDTEIVVDCGLDAAWALLTDYAGYADWNPYMVKIVGTAATGSTLRVTLHSTGPLVDTREVDINVLSVAPTSMRWEGVAGDRTLFHGDHWFVLQEVAPGKTRLHHYEHFTGSQCEAIMAQYGETIHTNFVRFNVAFRDRLVGKAKDDVLF
jgi:hypothetical protein